MRKAAGAKPAIDFSKPDKVVSVFIDPTSGLLANENCPKKREELYIAGTEPSEYCPKKEESVEKTLTKIPLQNKDEIKIETDINGAVSIKKE